MQKKRKTVFQIALDMVKKYEENERRILRDSRIHSNVISIDWLRFKKDRNNGMPYSEAIIAYNERLMKKFILEDKEST